MGKRNGKSSRGGGERGNGEGKEEKKDHRQPPTTIVTTIGAKKSSADMANLLLIFSPILVDPSDSSIPPEYYENFLISQYRYRESLLNAAGAEGIAMMSGYEAFHHLVMRLKVLFDRPLAVNFWGDYVH